MVFERVEIATGADKLPCFVFTPGGEAGRRSAVIVYMDAGGIRPAMMELAQRIADAGYVTLLPDLFYRYGAYDPFVPKEVLAGDFRAVLGPLMATTDNAKAAEDTGLLLNYLEARNDVVIGQVGVVGFCMGGGMAIAAAGTWPHRIIKVASFHGGRLATDDVTSPHRLAPMLEAEIYIAAAENDSSYPPDMGARLEEALTTAGVRYLSETYPAAHGWMLPDFPVYDREQAERGWSKMLNLFGSMRVEPAES